MALAVVRRLLPSLVLIGLCGLAGYYGSRLGRGAEPAAAATPQVPDAAPPSVPLIIERTRLVTQEGPTPQAAPATPVAPAAKPRAGSPDEQLLSELQADERDIERGKRQRLGLERAFQAEPVEASWARPTEALVRKRAGELFTDPNATKISSMECRASMCRAVFTHGDAKARDDFAGSERYLDLIESFPQSYFTHDPGGAGVAASTTVFLSRDAGGLVAQLEPTQPATEKP
jgi:hypothetical protein